MKAYIRNLFTALTALAALALTACGSDPEPPAKTTHRTVLVYMLASNNLGSSNTNFDEADLAEMLTAAKAGALGDGRLLVYHADYEGDPEMKEVTPQGINVIKAYTDGELSVSSSRMSRVLNDMKSIAPADDYGLILWGHATGWLQNGIEDPIDKAAPAPANDLSIEADVSYSYGYDHSTSKWMNISTLARTLEGRGLSFVYFDCCLMGSIETLYEMQAVAPIMVASPTEVPTKGMPYHHTLSHIFAKGSADLESASKAYFNYYKQNPTETGGCPVSTAVINTSKINALAEATKAVYAQASASWPEGYTGQLLYTNTNYYDFEHYVKALAGDDSQLFARWKAALDDVVRYKAATEWIWDIRPLSHYSGLSTFIMKTPSDAGRNNYNTLKWYGDVASALPL